MRTCLLGATCILQLFYSILEFPSFATCTTYSVSIQLTTALGHSPTVTQMSVTYRNKYRPSSQFLKNRIKTKISFRLFLQQEARNHQKKKIEH